MVAASLAGGGARNGRSCGTRRSPFSADGGHHVTVLTFDAQVLLPDAYPVPACLSGCARRLGESGNRWRSEQPPPASPCSRGVSTPAAARRGSPCSHRTNIICLLALLSERAHRGGHGPNCGTLRWFPLPAHGAGRGRQQGQLSLAGSGQAQRSPNDLLVSSPRPWGETTVIWRDSASKGCGRVMASSAWNRYSHRDGLTQSVSPLRPPRRRTSELGRWCRRRFNAPGPSRGLLRCVGTAARPSIRSCLSTPNGKQACDEWGGRSAPSMGCDHVTFQRRRRACTGRTAAVRRRSLSATRWTLDEGGVRSWRRSTTT